MKNLIFVAKDIGLECLKFHLETFNLDENHIVVCNPDKTKIIDYIKEKKLWYKDVDNFSVQELKNEKFDWLLNLWGGMIFKQDLLNLVNNSLNIHPSYLPYGRGRDPVVWAIREEMPAGVTLHEINELVDEGDIWYQEEVLYNIPITGCELYKIIIDACIKVFQKHWPKIRTLKYKKVLQSTFNMITKKRNDLFKDRVIKYQELQRIQKEIILKILAHDFGKDYTALLEIGDNKYKISFNLEKV